MIKKDFDDNSLHGASIILSTKIFIRFPQLGNELGYFIALEEFNKYVRYTSYGIEEQKILLEIQNDISNFNSYTRNAMPIDLDLWIAANFPNMLNFTLGYEEDEEE